MTRLESRNIESVSDRLAGYDEELSEKTGMTLKLLAVRAAGVDAKLADSLIPQRQVGVVPMTCGQGLIHGFSETLVAIARHLGFHAFCARATDAAGLAEAVERGADIILTADDNQYAAINLKAGTVADNSSATGRGFASALETMAGGLAGASVLVIGCGLVGRAAGRFFLDAGAIVQVYDTRPHMAEEWVRRMAAQGLNGARVLINLEEGLSQCRYILDATPAVGVIDESFIRPETMLSMPGVPCGISETSLERHGGRVIHDPLQIGTATMLMTVL